MSHSEHLFPEFPSISKKEWIASIERDLKGKKLAELETRLQDLSIDPFSHPDDLPLPPLPFESRNNDWRAGEIINVEDLLRANFQARRATEHGAQAILFKLHENLGDHRLESLLEGLDLEKITISFWELNKNPHPRSLLAHLQHVAVKQRCDLSKVSGTVNWSSEQDVVLEDAIQMMEFGLEKIDKFRFLPVNVQSGNSAVDDLTHAIIRGEFWINLLSQNGYSPLDINRHIHFSVPVGLNYFIEIARLRALKILWANVLKAYGVMDAEMPVIHAFLSPETLTDDPNQNMISATTQAMAAIVGGVNCLMLTPQSGGNSDELPVRVALNVQHILRLEGGFDRVADPIAGSWFVENLTQRLAKACWEKFQREAE
jgi:methylmalonyl-CoA mutase